MDVTAGKFDSLLILTDVSIPM